MTVLKKKKSVKSTVAVLWVCSLFTGCASSPMEGREVQEWFASGRYIDIIQKIEAWLAKEGDGDHDSLLAYLDLGLVYHHQKDYKKSIQAFRKAADMAEIRDYTSLAEEAGAILTSERNKKYKGEDYERLLITVYQALNYACMGQPEEAIVEIRKLNSQLYRYRNEGKRDYPDFAFMSYLSGILYEKNKEYDDAYLSYNTTRKQMPEFSQVGEDLIRLSRMTRRMDELEKWKKSYPATEETKDRKDAASLIVVLDVGQAPKKVPSGILGLMPAFQSQSFPLVGKGFVKVNVHPSESEKSVETHEQAQSLMSVENLARKNLDLKWGALVARRAAAIAARQGVDYAITKTTKQPLLGDLAKIALYLSDRPDLRSWDLLPRDLYVARVWVKPGQHWIQVDGPNQSVLFKGAMDFPKNSLQWIRLVLR